MVLGSVPGFLLVCAVVFVVHSLIFSRKPDSEDCPQKNTLPLEDTVLALCLICSPLAIYATTKLTHGPFMARYALVAALGLSFLLAQSLTFFSRRARTTSVVLLFVVGIGLSAFTIRALMKGWRARNPFELALSSVLKDIGDNELVVFGSGLDFLQADYYAPPEMATRLAFVADRQLANQIAGTDGVDSTFSLGFRYLRLRGRVISYQQLRQMHRSFWLVDNANPLNWISEQLRSNGADMRVLNVPNTRVLHVNFPEPRRIVTSPIDRGNHVPLPEVQLTLDGQRYPGAAVIDRSPQ